jgi:sugar/nucleoside kinase (ribokinase family)
VRALILSRDDLLLPDASLEQMEETNAEIAAWAREVPLVVVTRGADGANLHARGAPVGSFPGVMACEVDPTGAGDVFAAAFLCWLDHTGDAPAAMTFANHVAAFSVERIGVESAPTRAELIARFPNTGFASQLTGDDQSASSS